ncbi:hypothetical protein Tco_1377619 [Tanacetum coccineum]
MSKVLQERGFGSLPGSIETNPRDQVKSISTATADLSEIRRIKHGPYAISGSQYRFMFHEKVPFPRRLHNYCCDGLKEAHGANILDAYDDILPKKEKDPGSFTLPLIMESLVKKKQKGAILELKRRHLKNTIFCTYTPYPAMKIRRISASSAQETRNDQFPIRRIHYNQYAVCTAVHQASAFLFLIIGTWLMEKLAKLLIRILAFSRSTPDLSTHDDPAVNNIHGSYGILITDVSGGASSGFSIRKSARICPFTDVLGRHVILCSPSIMLYFCNRPAISGRDIICLIGWSVITTMGCAWKYLRNLLAAKTSARTSFSIGV